MNPRPILVLALLATPAMAAPFQNIDALEARLTGALGAGIGEAGGPVAPIDRRLKLAACPANVAIEPPLLGAVTIRCGTTWRIRVPLVHLAATTPTGGRMAPVAKVDPVVRRGDPVDLVADAEGFSVSVSGIAQEDGAPGARIRVRTDAKNQPVFAEVIDAGRVRLPGFK